MASYRAQKWTTTNCQTHSHKRVSSHLIYLPQFSAVGRRGRAPVRPVNLGAALSPSGGGGNGGPLKGWGHFLCLRALAGKIKCLHSVSPALFQMPLQPFKRPLWAWMANERFWDLTIYSFSLSSLPSSIPQNVSDANPKSLLYFYSKCESAETDI